MRPVQAGLPCPVLPARRARRHRERRRAAAARHEDLDDRIVADDSQGPDRHAEAPGDEAQRQERGLPGERHGCARQTADGSRDRKRIADRASLLGGEEGDVGGYAELSAAPDGLTGGLDVLHAALRMPADEDAPDLRCPGLAGVHRLDAGVAQSLPHASAPEDQRPPDAAALHVIRRDAGGGDHLLVIDGESDLTQLRGLLRRRVGTAVGEKREGHVPLFECAQDFDRSRQHLVATERAVAEEQRPVDVEHHALHRCGPARQAALHDRTHAGSVREPAPPRSSSLKSDFTTLSSAMLRSFSTRRRSSITGFDSGS